MSITSHFGYLGSLAACDTETALAPLSFKGRKHVRLIQFWGENHNFSFDLKMFNEAQWQELKENMEGRDLTLIFQNALFDLRVLQGCKIRPRKLVHDTMLQSYCLTNGDPVPKIEGIKSNLSLAAIAHRELGVTVDKTLQAQDWMNADLTEEDMAYAMKDVQLTWEAFHRMKTKIFEQDLETVYEIERKTLLPVLQMESTGVLVSRDLLDDTKADYIEQRDSNLKLFVETLDSELPGGLPRHEVCDENRMLTHLHGEINTVSADSGNVKAGTKQRAGFNPNSSQQILKHFNTLGIYPMMPPSFKYPDGKASIDQKVLPEWAHYPVVSYYMKWKKANTLVTFCESVIKAQDPENGRIYPRFNQTGTGTGRFSSSKPNIQQTPRGQIRYAYMAGEGRAFVDLDFSGMELRAACSKAIADEPAMRNAFNSGQDVHRSTAARMFDIPQEEVTDEQRRQSKAVSFGALFGSSPSGLVNYFASLGLTITRKEGETFLNAWLKAYPKIAKWHRHCKAQVEAGNPVVMVDGRKRNLQGEQNRHTIFANNTVQGSCASVVKLAMYGIHDQLHKVDSTARLVAQIHDELLIECAADKAPLVLSLAEAVMVEAGAEIFGDDIQMTAEGGIGNSWGDAH